MKANLKRLGVPLREIRYLPPTITLTMRVWPKS